MNRFLVVVPALIALAGCGSPASEAEARYAFLKENGASLSELCNAARAVQAAYVDEGDAKAFNDARLSADLECSRNELEAVLTEAEVGLDLDNAANVALEDAEAALARADAALAE